MILKDFGMDRPLISEVHTVAQALGALKTAFGCFISGRMAEFPAA
jgi:hypothetical protein